MADVKKHGLRALLALVGGAASLLAGCGGQDSTSAPDARTEGAYDAAYGPPAYYDAARPDAQPTYYGADAGYGPPSCYDNSTCESWMGSGWYCADNHVCAPKRDGGI